MKIYILHECYIGPTTYHQHDTPDLPPNIAIPLIDSGFANVYGGGTSTATGEQPSGWVNNDTITVTYAAGIGARITLTSVGEKIYYVWRGKLKSVANGWTSEALNFSAGQIVWLYSHDGKTFHWSTTPPALDDLWVAAAVPGLQFAIKLIYGVQDAAVRDLVRKTVRAVIASGGGLTADTYALHTDTDAANTPGFDLAILRDVDINSTNNARLDTKYTWMWFEGQSNVNFDKDKTAPFKIPLGGVHPIVNTYDKTDGFSWIEAGTLKYLNYWVVRIPVTSDVVSQDYRTVILQPQRQYATLLEAQSETPKALNLGLFNDLKYDCVFSECLTYLTDLSFTTTGKVQLADYRVNLDDVEGWFFIAYDKEGNPILGREVNPGAEMKLQAGDRVTLTALAENDGVKIKAEACWYGGTAAPGVDAYLIGDFYLNYTDGKLYEKTAIGVWTHRYTFTTSSVALVDDILHFDTNKYTPYASNQSGKLYRGTDDPNRMVNTRLNYGGEFYAHSFWTDLYNYLTQGGIILSTPAYDTHARQKLGIGTTLGGIQFWALQEVAAGGEEWSSAPIVIGHKMSHESYYDKGQYIELDDLNEIFNIFVTKIFWNGGTANKWLKLNANKEIECVDAPEAGATSYIELTDTDDTTFTGKEDYVPVVNSAETGLVLTESVIAAFDLLSDVPSSKTGQGNKIVKVNSGGTALEYVSGASGTFTTADSKTVTVTNGIITSIV